MSRKKNRKPDNSTAVNEDGWPLEPDNSTAVDEDGWPLAAATLSVEAANFRFIRDRMRRYRRGWKAGHAVAVTDAVRFCDRHKVPHPDWLKAAVRSLADPPQKRKRGQPPADEADLIRWDVVVMLRLGRGEDRKVYKWDEVFEAASKYLEGTPHWGTADTISASYKRVIKRDRLTPGRYYTKDL